MHKTNCIVRKHSFAQIEFICSLMLNQFLLQLNQILRYYVYKN